MTLLCRIVRISWHQSAYFKECVPKVLRLYKEENTIANVLPFIIFSELIYQFQLGNLPPKNQQTRLIQDFKDNCLISIYELTTESLYNIFVRKLLFENLTHYIYFLREISKVLNECMDYEEDLNVKTENYKKFEIKPIFVPNNHRRNGQRRDRSLDFSTLETICKCLFECHNILTKSVKEYKIFYLINLETALSKIKHLFVLHFCKNIAPSNFSTWEIRKNIF